MSKKHSSNPEAGDDSAKPDPSTFVPMTFTANSEYPTLADAAAAVGVKVEDCDADYGVVVIDLSKRLFSIMSRSCHTKNPDGTPFAGPWSDPRISSY